MYKTRLPAKQDIYSSSFAHLHFRGPKSFEGAIRRVAPPSLPFPHPPGSLLHRHSKKVPRLRCKTAPLLQTRDAPQHVLELTIRGAGRVLGDHYVLPQINQIR